VLLSSDKKAHAGNVVSKGEYLCVYVERERERERERENVWRYFLWGSIWLNSGSYIFFLLVISTF
jgi:hypothetical protein